MLRVDARKLSAQLRWEEDARRTPYQDSQGLWTIGVGHCLETTPLTLEELVALGMPIPSLRRVPLNEQLRWFALHPLTDGQIEYLLAKDLVVVFARLDAEHPWVGDIESEVRQRVLADLYFNVGGATFAAFEPTWVHARAGEWDLVAAHMRHWKWYQDVKPRRADPLIAMMRTGEDAPARA